MAAGAVPPRLGRLLQAALRRTGTCTALPRRLHPSRRHLQQQAGCSLPGQRHLPLARFRPRQQEAAHDSGCRRVPAPLPAPCIAACFRAHPQLRIPRQPEPCYAVAPVLPTARQLREDDCFGAITVPRTDSPTLELSSLRWNHARRRTALRGSTPASLTTATRPVRCMNRNQQPRPLPVLWRACRSLVSTGQDWSATDLSSYRTTPQCVASNFTSYFKAADRTHYSEFMHSPNTSGPIQNT